jgi:hypothetical protein
MAEEARMRRFIALALIGLALVVIGMAGMSFDVADSGGIEVGTAAQSGLDIGAAGAVIDHGFDRSLEHKAVKKSGTGSTYEAVKART